MLFNPFKLTFFFFFFKLTLILLAIKIFPKPYIVSILLMEKSYLTHILNRIND